mmetsp:Transcript_10104/g.25917  ORF Transcript_10104/g.25917 Transcript_10104/m.25917 type:complete len:255 (+) Transcript_10104:939-1703(+)
MRHRGPATARVVCAPHPRHQGSWTGLCVAPDSPQKWSMKLDTSRKHQKTSRCWHYCSCPSNKCILALAAALSPHEAPQRPPAARALLAFVAAGPMTAATQPPRRPREAPRRPQAPAAAPRRPRAWGPTTGPKAAASASLRPPTLREPLPTLQPPTPLGCRRPRCRAAWWGIRQPSLQLPLSVSEPLADQHRSCLGQAVNLGLGPPKPRHGMRIVRCAPRRPLPLCCSTTCLVHPRDLTTPWPFRGKYSTWTNMA